LERLADWFDSIAKGAPIEAGIYFIERDLELTVAPDNGILTVHVFRDFLPPWNEGADSIAIEFPVSAIDLPSAVASLRRQLLAFPGRPPLA
jgi:hypothetical protein